MTARDVSPNFQDKCCSKLPIKIPQVRCKEGKQPCCYAAMYSTACEDTEINIGSSDELSCHPELPNRQCLVDKSTQMSLKNFYESYLFEGLLTANDDIKQRGSPNTENTTDELDPLADIKNLLLTTNTKLDLILSTLLTEKTEHPINMSSKQRKSKIKLKQKMEGFKTPSRLSLSLTRSEDMSDMQAHMCPWAKCLSSTCISRLRPNPYYMSPYCPPYYVKPLSHYNYFKCFGPKYSDPDMTNSMWSPFMFMATSFNVKKLQNSANREKLHHCKDNNCVSVSVNGQNAEGVEYSGDSLDYPPCPEEIEPMDLPC